MEYLSRDKKFKTPFGCVKRGEEITISALASRDAKVSLLLMKDKAFYNIFELKYSEKLNMHTVSFSLEETGIYFYYFTENGEPVYKNGKDKWQLLCYEENFDTPDFYKGGVMYQIFPDRFYKSGDPDLSEKLTPYWVHSDFDETPEYRPDIFNKIPNNDFFGGNLKGIKEKLGYLKELGIDIIYLNPIFKAFSNHRYDTADYKTIDPMLGTNEDFKELCREAHRLGMKIILDGVFSHTGETSIYFDKYNTYGNGAYNNPDSPYRSWYNFYEYPKKYECWWGIEILPCVNETDEKFRDFIINSEDSVITYWQKMGADGFRLDVADELPDSFIEELYSKVKQNNKDGFVLGEVWEDASNKISYGKRRKYLYGTELDSVMNYVYKDALINFTLETITARSFIEAVETVLENYPEPFWHTLMNILGTHDTPRILNVLSGHEFGNMTRAECASYRLNDSEYTLAKMRMFFAAFLQFTLPGMPSVYYGDEIGMQGFSDPFNRGFYKWNSPDSDIYNYYKALIALKKKYPSLKTGGFESVYATDKALAFKRFLGDEEIMIYANTADEPLNIRAEGELIFEKHSARESEEIKLYKYGVCAFYQHRLDRD